MANKKSGPKSTAFFCHRLAQDFSQTIKVSQSVLVWVSLWLKRKWFQYFGGELWAGDSFWKTEGMKAPSLACPDIHFQWEKNTGDFKMPILEKFYDVTGRNPLSTG